MKKVRFYTKVKSLSLVEVLLSIALFSIFSLFLVSSLLYGQESAIQASSRVRAVSIAEEGLEATRGMRNEKFTNLTDGSFGLTASGGKWESSGSSDTVDGFSREVTVSTVSESVKKIKSIVTWPQSSQRTGNISLETYLTDWSKKKPGGSWTEPTPEPPLPLPDNVAGLKIQTQGDFAYVVRGNATANFIIVDITDPSVPQIKATLDLPGEPTNIAVSGAYAYVSNKDKLQNVQIINITDPAKPNFDPAWSFKGIGNEPGTSLVEKDSRIYLTREYKNISNSPTFYKIDVTNPTAPTSLGYLRLQEPVLGIPLSAFDVYVSGNYAYVAAGLFRTGLGILPYLTVVDISQDQPVIKKTVTPFNLQDWNFGNAISISGYENTVVLGQEGPGNRVYTYDITDPVNPVLKGKHNAAGRVNDISFGNNSTFSYLATDAPDQEFQLLDVSNPSSPTLVGKTDMPDVLSGVCYSWDKDRIFVVGGQNNGGFIVIKPK